jgi:hypothetical protein
LSNPIFLQPDPAPQTDPQPADPAPAPDSDPDRGFPKSTPIDEMTAEQQAAYWKYHDRRKSDTLKAYGGITAEQAKQNARRLQEFEDGKLTADQKALKDATTQAAKDARTAADAEWSQKYLRSEMKSLVSSVITDKEQRDAFMAVTDPTKFVGENGEIDEQKVMGYLTAMFGGSGNNSNGQHQSHQSGNGHQQQRNWGQHSGGTGGGPSRPGDAGRAAATKRFGTKTT